MSDQSTSLDHLHDLVPPREIGWWPLASGWYVVGAIFVLLAIFAGFRCWKRWKRNAYRRAALKELSRVSDENEVAVILRRTALAFAPRSFVAAKAGTDWADWLDSLIPEAMPEEVRCQVSAGPYEKAGTSGNFTVLRQYAEQWIRRHAPAEENFNQTHQS